MDVPAAPAANPPSPAPAPRRGLPARAARAALLASRRLLKLALVAAAAALVFGWLWPEAVWRHALPWAVGRATGAHLAFSRVSAPAPLAPLLSDVRLVTSDGLRFAARTAQFEVHPTALVGGGPLVGTVTLAGLSLAGEPPLLFETAAVTPDPAEPSLLLFDGAVRGAGDARGRVAGSFDYGAYRGEVRIEGRDVEAAPLLRLARFGAVVAGRARGSVNVRFARAADGAWAVSPDADLRVDDAALVLDGVRLEGVAGTVVVTDDGLSGRIERACLATPSLPRLNGSASCSWTTAAGLRLDDLTIAEAPGLRAALALALPRGDLAVEVRDAPVTPLLELLGLRVVPAGRATGTVHARFERDSDGAWSVAPRAALSVIGVTVALPSLRLEGLGGTVTATDGRVDGRFERATLALRGLPRLAAAGAVSWTTGSGLRLDDVELREARGLRARLSLSLPPGEALPTALTLEAEGLPVGPRWLLAPRFLGQPAAGRLALSADLSRSPGAPPGAVAGRAEARFLGTWAGLDPVSAALSLRQTTDAASLTATVTGPPEVGALSLGARLTRGDAASASLVASGVPLALLPRSLPAYLADARTSLGATARWLAAPDAWPLASLAAAPPRTATVDLDRARLTSGDGPPLAALRVPARLEWGRPPADGPWPSALAGLGGALQLSLLGHPTTVTLTPAAGAEPPRAKLDLPGLDLAALFQERFPGQLFTKVLGSLNVLVDAWPDADGAPVVEGGATLVGGRLEHWRKSDGLIRRLRLDLPSPLRLTLSRRPPPVDGAAPLPVTSAADVAVTVAPDGVHLEARQLRAGWVEEEPLARRVVRRGEVSAAGALFVPASSEASPSGRWDLRGFVDRPELGPAGRVTLQGDLRARARGEVEFALAVRSPGGGANASLETTFTADHVAAQLSTDAWPLSAVTGWPGLADASLSSAVTARVRFPGGLLGALVEGAAEPAEALTLLARQEGELTVSRLALTQAATAPTSSAPAGAATSSELLVAARPWRARLRPEGVTLEGVELCFAGHRLRADGTFDPFGPCDLTLESDGVPVAVVASLLGLPAAGATGTVTANVRLRGRMPVPDLEGRIHVDRASLALPPLDQRLVLPALHVESRGPTTRVSATGLTFGSVPLRLVAEATTVGGSPSGNLLLDGTGLRATFRGSRLDGIDLSARLDLTSEVPRLQVTLACRDGLLNLPTSLPAPAGVRGATTAGRALRSLLGQVRTEATLTLPARLRVRNPFIDAEVTGGAKLEARPTPALQARFDLIHGEVVLHRRRFELSQGTLAVSGSPFAPRATVTLSGRTEVQGHRVELQVSGSLDDPTVQLTAEPPMPEEDVVSLLMTGLVPLAADAADPYGALKDDLQATAKDYVMTSALNQVLASQLGIESVSLRTTTEGSFIRMRKYVTDRLLVTVDHNLSAPEAALYQEQGARTSYSFEFGLNDSVFIQGRTEETTLGAERDQYLGVLRKLRFR